MGLFGKNREGGFMDEIRCDEASYLIWKWRPNGKANDSHRENAIRWGSSLRVRQGSVAVFVHSIDGQIAQDFIEGPFDGLLNTQNLPVIASIIGAAYDGGTPWQAEVYFINMAQIIQVKFAVPYFDVYDPRFLDFGVPVAARGTITFRIRDYLEFIELHRLDDFDIEAFRGQLRDAISKYAKGIIANIPSEHGIPLVQMETRIMQISELIERCVSQRLEQDFGVMVSGVDVAAVEVDKQSEGYKQLLAVTKDISTATVQAQAETNIKNLQDMQRINAENMEETLRIQREEGQYAQHLQTQGANFDVYKFGRQADAAIAGAEALGEMGANGGASINGDGGMNPAGMMAGIAMGGVIGQNMASMMNGMMGAVNQEQVQMQTPPPVPMTAYNVVINGQSSGPFDMAALAQMASSGQISSDSYVWKRGMNDWAKASDVQELSGLFCESTTDMPPIPSDAQ